MKKITPIILGLSSFFCGLIFLVLPAWAENWVETTVLESEPTFFDSDSAYVDVATGLVVVEFAGKFAGGAGRRGRDPSDSPRRFALGNRRRLGVRRLRAKRSSRRGRPPFSRKIQTWRQERFDHLLQCRLDRGPGPRARGLRRGRSARRHETDRRHETRQISSPWLSFGLADARRAISHGPPQWQDPLNESGPRTRLYPRNARRQPLCGRRYGRRQDPGAPVTTPPSASGEADRSIRRADCRWRQQFPDRRAAAAGRPCC